MWFVEHLYLQYIQTNKHLFTITSKDTIGIYPRNIQDIQEPRIDYPELSYSKDRLSLQDIS